MDDTTFAPPEEEETSTTVGGAAESSIIITVCRRLLPAAISPCGVDGNGACMGGRTGVRGTFSVDASGVETQGIDGMSVEISLRAEDGRDLMGRWKREIDRAGMVGDGVVGCVRLELVRECGVSGVGALVRSEDLEEEVVGWDEEETEALLTSLFGSVREICGPPRVRSLSFSRSSSSSSSSSLAFMASILASIQSRIRPMDISPLRGLSEVEGAMPPTETPCWIIIMRSWHAAAYPAL